MAGEKICNNCGKKNPTDAHFCIYCGGKLIQEVYLQNTCPNCGNIINKDSKFCHVCGYQVKERNSSQHYQIPVHDGLYHDNNFERSSSNHKQRNSIPQDMGFYSGDQRNYRQKQGTRKVKKQGISGKKGFNYNPMYIPVSLFIIVLISAFIVAWQITIILAFIAVIAYFYVKKKYSYKERNDWMG